MRRNLQRLVLLVVACVVTAPAFAQRGAMTVPRNLHQLTDRASDIVRGTVVSAHVEKHPELTNLDTVVVTLRVRETAKGQASGTYTFRQYIWDIRDRRDAAGYRKGQQYLLLMNAPSRHGLTSPAGMEQGRFRLSRDATGKEVAVYGRGNVMLMSDLTGIGGEIDTVVEIVNSSGNRLQTCGAPTFTAECMNDDRAPGNLDSFLVARISGPATVYIHVVEWRGDGRPDLRYILLLSGIN